MRQMINGRAAMMKPTYRNRPRKKSMFLPSATPTTFMLNGIIPTVWPRHDHMPAR